MIWWHKWHKMTHDIKCTHCHDTCWHTTMYISHRRGHIARSYLRHDTALCAPLHGAVPWRRGATDCGMWHHFLYCGADRSVQHSTTYLFVWPVCVYLCLCVSDEFGCNRLSCVVEQIAQYICSIINLVWHIIYLFQCLLMPFDLLPCSNVFKISRLNF